MKSIIIIVTLACLIVGCKENNKQVEAETKALIAHEEAYRQANPLAALQKGNAEYTKKLAENPKLHEEFEHNKKEQHPFAVLVSCSDSRVPPSAVFNQDLGHLFKNVLKLMCGIPSKRLRLMVISSRNISKRANCKSSVLFMTYHQGKSSF